jgi:hypothetical protein
VGKLAFGLSSFPRFPQGVISTAVSGASRRRPDRVQNLGGKYQPQDKPLQVVVFLWQYGACNAKREKGSSQRDATQNAETVKSSTSTAT